MSKTILLADDSVTIRKVVELTFMEEDYELVSVGGGDEALERLQEADPDLVIADIHMPGVTGYEVCRAAKEHRSERPVLLLVGTFEPFDADELEASGADGHLKKPFDSQELLQTVRDLLSSGEEAPAEEAAAEDGEAAAEDGAAFAEEGEDTSEAAGVLSAPASIEAAMSDAEIESGSVLTVDEAGGVEAVDEDAASEVLEVSATEDEPEAVEAATNGGGDLSDEAIERIAHRVAELLGPDAVRDVAWEVVPDLAEVVIKERLRELESQVE